MKLRVIAGLGATMSTGFFGHVCKCSEVPEFWYIDLVFTKLINNVLDFFRWFVLCC